MDDLLHVHFEGADPPVLPARRPRPLPPPRPAVEPPPADPFLEELLRESGLDPAAYRPRALQRRLPACLRQLRVRTTDEARALLRRDPRLRASALDAALLGVTEFFRDATVFEAVRDLVVPDLARRRGLLRACSAGASDGHELYSLAILLDEAGLLERASLLGIDCRLSALLRAEAGLFDAADMETLSPARRARYFRSDLSGFVAAPRLRDRLSWRIADLLAFDDGPFDLLLCRNVAIYLRPEAAAALWDRLHARLVPGGWLVTGKAETPAGRRPWTRIRPSVFRRAP